MPEVLGTVDVSEGFYPRFSEAFRDHYGPSSVFVRATADTFTVGLAPLLAAHNRLPAGTVIPKLAPATARKAVVQLLSAAPRCKVLLLQEAFGSIPLGSFGQAVDNELGPGTFSRWLHALEALDLECIRRLLLAQNQGA